jgi:hypothetical protein
VSPIGDSCGTLRYFFFKSDSQDEEDAEAELDFTSRLLLSLLGFVLRDCSLAMRSLKDILSPPLVGGFLLIMPSLTIF